MQSLKEEPRSRVWDVAFAVVTITSALPIFATRYLPITDVAEHVAAIATMSRFLGGGASGYRLSVDRSQYVLYDVAGALVTRVVGDPVFANQLLLASAAIGWCLALRALLRALGRDERLSVFGGMLFWNRALVIGFLPFLASVPLAVFGVALAVRQALVPTVRRAFAIAALSVVLFYTHLSTWTLFAAIACAVAALTMLPTLRPRSVVLAIGPLVPSITLALVWWRRGVLADSTGNEAVHRYAIGHALGAVPVWIFDIWRTHVDEVCAIVWWLAFSVLLVKAARPGPPLAPDLRRHAFIVFAPFACTLLAYLATPFGIGKTAYLNVRLAPLLAVFALLWLRPRRDAWGTIPLAAGVVASLATAGAATYEFHRAAREALGDFDALLAQMRPGARVLTLSFENRSSRLHYYPYVYAGSYHRVRHEATAFYSFTELSHWPIQYEAGERPPAAFSEDATIAQGAWPAFIPCAYRYRRDGAFYDYVLVQGEKNPFAATTIGPEFRPVATSGRFTLYTKVGPGADDGTGPDRGPCEH